MNEEKYYKNIQLVGASEYHIGILLKCLIKHFDAKENDMDYTTIVAIEQAEEFLKELKGKDDTSMAKVLAKLNHIESKLNKDISALRTKQSKKSVDRSIDS
jgi:hypothetical protein